MQSVVHYSSRFFFRADKADQQRSQRFLMIYVPIHRHIVNRPSDSLRCGHANPMTQTGKSGSSAVNILKKTWYQVVEVHEVENHYL